MNFYGRTDELNKINRMVSADNLLVTLIYGRRRIGKSELVKQVIKTNSIKSIYYECKQVAEASNAQGLCEIISEQWNLPKLGYTSIEEVLEYIFGISKDEKIILVIDEYPYMRENVKGMDSILQCLIDKYRNSTKLKLFILGSYVDTMKALLEHSNPFYGRVDLTINLQQMDYYESAKFYPNFSNEDKVKIYSVFGGVPYYNCLIDDNKTVKENIIDLIASDGARLENEVSMYLNSEISKIMNANEVFEALAKDYSRYSDILSQSYVSSGPTLVDVLDKLIRMEIVTKIAPINDAGNKKKTGYYICDNLSLFYYRYIFRYISQMKIMDSDIFYKKYIEKDFEEQYVPHRFEEICKQYLIRCNKRGIMNPIFEKIGKYYYDDPVNHKNGEFDIVTEDERGYVFYEVKFRENSISEKEVLKEVEQINAAGLKCYKYVFISRSGFKGEKCDGIEWIQLDELYKNL